MKLPKVTKNDPIVRLAVGIPESVNNSLKVYQDFYKAETGEEIPMGMMVQEMLKSFLSEDKAFNKFKLSSATGAKALGEETFPK